MIFANFGSKYYFHFLKSLTRLCSFYLDIDECASNPCQHNSTCVDGVASYTCDCLAGFTGAECQTSE